MIAPQHKEQLADEFNMTTKEIEVFWSAFSSISRVSHIKTYTLLEKTIMENVEGNMRSYDELPYRLKDIVRRAIKEGRDLGSFFGDMDNVDNLRKFIRKLKKERTQPRDLCIIGNLTYRHLQMGDERNHLKEPEVRVYKPSGEVA